MAKLGPLEANNEGAAFAVGDTVVHPHHGAGRVVSRRRRRTLGSAARNYLEIELDDFLAADHRALRRCERRRSSSGGGEASVAADRGRARG